MNELNEKKKLPDFNEFKGLSIIQENHKHLQFDNLQFLTCVGMNELSHLTGEKLEELTIKRCNIESIVAENAKVIKFDNCLKLKKIDAKSAFAIQLVNCSSDVELNVPPNFKIIKLNLKDTQS